MKRQNYTLAHREFRNGASVASGKAVGGDVFVSSQQRSLICRAGAVFFVALSPVLFSTIVHAACGAPGGSVLFNSAGNTCTIIDGNYVGNQTILSNAGTIENTGAVNLSVTPGGTSRGIFADGAGAVIRLNDVTIGPVTSAGGTAVYGAHAGNGGNVVIGGDYNLTGSGTVWGIAAGMLGTGGTVTANNVNIRITSGNSGAGLITSTLASNVLTVNGTLVIDNAATNSVGVTAAVNSTINLLGGSNAVTMRATGGRGIALNTNSTINVSNALTIIGTGSGAVGISTAGGTITLNATDVTTTGSGVLASAAGRVTAASGLLRVRTSEASAYGAYATGAGSIITLVNADIATTGSGSHGIYAAAGGRVALTGSQAVVGVVGNSLTHGLYASGANSLITTAAGTNLQVSHTGGAVGTNRPYGILASTSGRVQLDGDTTITSSGLNSFAMRAESSGALTINGDTDITMQQGTGMQSTLGGSVLTLNGGQHTLRINGQGGSISNGILVSDGATFNIVGGNTSITTTGSGAHGIQMQTSGSLLNLGGAVNIDINATDSYGFYLNSGAQRTADGTATANVRLPTIVVHGQNSAVLAANGAGSLFTLTGTAVLDTSMTAGANTWGAKAQALGAVTLTGGSSSGGTGLWASNGTLNLLGSAEAAGSRVLLENSGILNLQSTGTTTMVIGSLEGVAGTTVNLYGHTLSIGSNNAGNTGSLVDGATFAGSFGNAAAGSLLKTGSTTQILTGINTVASVGVQGGTLRLAQNGSFTTTGNYSTQSGATTDVGLNSSRLIVGGTFTQAAGSTLKVTLGASPDITATSASLNGTLLINGFNAADPARATDVTARGTYYTLLRTSTGIITGDFTNARVQDGDLDYLLSGGYVSSDNKEYRIGFALSWTDGRQSDSTGDFTVNNGTSFNLDIALSDQAVPVGDFDTGWDGKSLVKEGDGLLVISEAQLYTGTTTVRAGTLRTDDANIFATNEALIVNGGVLNLNGTSQLGRNLSGTGGTIQLTGGASALTVDNLVAGTDDSLFAGNFTGAGSLTKTGAGTLTLTGSAAHTGLTTVSAGTLSIGNGGNSGSISGNILNNAALVFDRNNASAYAGVLSGTGALTKQGTGVLILSGANSVQGSVDVREGTARFVQDDGIGATTSFATTGAYTTRTGATTELGSNNSVFDIGGAFTQEIGSALEVELGAWLAGARADIEADSAVLNGTLEILGFSVGAEPNSSSILTTSGYKLIDTVNGIVGTYSGVNLIGTDDTGLDYLMITSNLRDSSRELWLGFQLTWTDGGQSFGTGNFTINSGRFTVDTVLADQTGFTGGPSGDLSDKGWNGKDFVKNGDGTLRFAALNTYTGTTTVNAGMLQAMAGWDNVFATSSAIIVEGGVLDLNGTKQRAQKLSGSGGAVTLGGGILTAHNATVADSSQYGGTISGDGTLIKTGLGSLTLTGLTEVTQTHLNEGDLVLSGNAARLVSDVIGKDRTHLSLVNGASLTGTIDPTDVSIDARSVWTMTGTSDVATLDLAGRIEFAVPSTQPLTQGRVLTASNWHGQGGTVTLYTTLGSDTSATDTIVIDGGQATGSTSLDIRNAGGLGAQTVGNGIKVVEAVNGGSTEVSAFSLSGRVAAGAYDYSLFRGDTAGAGDGWYLRSAQRSGRPEYRDEVPVAMTVTPLASRLGLDMLGTYDDRRGMRGMSSSSNAQQRGGAAWGRVFGTTGNVGSSTFTSDGPSYDRDISGLQAGVDLYSREGASGDRDTLGVYLGVGRAEGKVDKALGGGRAGKVDLNSYGLGAYWTHQGASGWYTDTVLQGTSYRQGTASSEAGEQFKTAGWGLAASVEAGYPLALAAGWTLEPQGQLVYQVVNLDDGADRFGQIALDDTSVLYGRIGAKLNKAFALEGGRPLNVWGRMNVWNTFGQDATATFSDLHGNNAVSLSSRLGGTWGQIGAGISGTISDGTALFAGVDYERVLGAGSGDSIAGRVGVSVSW